MISTIIRAHNEEKYIENAMFSALRGGSDEVIVVLDRCIDGTEYKVKVWTKTNKIVIIKKDEIKWKCSTAENVKLGLDVAKGDIIVIHDADISGYGNFLIELSELLIGRVVIVGPRVEQLGGTDFKSTLYRFYEKTKRYNLGEQPKGGIMMINRKELGNIEISDTNSWDTKLLMDIKERGYIYYVYNDCLCSNMRPFSFRRAVSSQIKSGEERRKLKYPIHLTIAHSIFRLRPFVIYGYIKEMIR